MFPADAAIHAQPPLPGTARFTATMAPWIAEAKRVLMGAQADRTMGFRVARCIEHQRAHHAEPRFRREVFVTNSGAYPASARLTADFADFDLEA